MIGSSGNPTCRRILRKTVRAQWFVTLSHEGLRSLFDRREFPQLRLSLSPQHGRDLCRT